MTITQLSLSGSPWSYTNEGVAVCNIIISGGSVSDIKIDGVSISAQSTSLVSLPLDIGKNIEITYTNAPTVYLYEMM